MTKILKATINIEDSIFVNIYVQNNIANTFKMQNLSQMQGNRSKHSNKRRCLTHHFQYKTGKMNIKLLKRNET